MASSISVYNFLNSNHFEEKIGKDEGVEYVEDLIFKVASSILQVNPVGVHLFALYNPKLRIWLCPNQRLSTLQDELKEEFKVNELNFEFKIRYLPSSSLELFVSGRRGMRFQPTS